MNPSVADILTFLAVVAGGSLLMFACIAVIVLGAFEAWINRRS